MNVPLDFFVWPPMWLSDGDLLQWLTTTSTAFLLIAAAEIGDKSQLVCMTLAARYRPWPVLLGAVAAFALLNLAAVVFGAMVAAWVPEQIVAAIVAVLFGVFGIHALFVGEDGGDDAVQVERSGHSLFASTFALIVVAEFGDKTQLAVAGFSSTAAALPVWIGSTLALLFTSALGVWAGRTVLQLLPMQLLHRISGAAFLILAAVAAYRATPPDWVGAVDAWIQLILACFAT